MISFDAVLVLILVLFCIIIHEVAHGVAARYFGDNTAEMMGRITLDPMKHIDPIMTIALPLIMFLTAGVALGAAKPVPVNPYRLRHPRKDMMWVALAGPISNILLGLLFALGAYIGHLLTPEPISGSFAWRTQAVFSYVVLMNFILAALNLIPIPPLDGSRVVARFLPAHLAQKYDSLGKFGMIILLVLLFSGGLSPLLRPVQPVWEAVTPIQTQMIFLERWRR